jgi:hypothetical protein
MISTAVEREDGSVERWEREPWGQWHLGRVMAPEEVERLSSVVAGPPVPLATRPDMLWWFVRSQWTAAFKYAVCGESGVAREVMDNAMGASGLGFLRAEPDLPVIFDPPLPTTTEGGADE